MVKAVFLDRDGTINKDQQGYIKEPEKLILYEYAGRAIRILNEAGYKVIVVTNQSGIARGYYTKEQLQKVNDKMKKDLASEEARIDGIYFSPWHIEGIIEPYNIIHEDRKPDIGMYKKACRDFGINPKLSYMIGDKESDIGFAKNAGLTSILVKTGCGTREFMELRDQWQHYPDYMVEDLLSAAKLIMKLEK